MPASLFTSPQSSYNFDPGYGARRSSQVVKVLGPDGAPLANTEVVVSQLNHAFLFGNIGFELVDYINDYQYRPAGAGDVSEYNAVAAQRSYDSQLAENWLSVFNQATLPFYWGRFEPVEGEPRFDELRNAAQWFKDRDVVVKGHPLVWHTVQPAWLMGKSTSEVERLLRGRITREAGSFAGLIDFWDAINEVVIMPTFDNGDNAITPLAREKGRIEMIRMAFETARAANPNVTLILNDFDMSTAYECLIEGVLEAGIKIDKLGLQSHQQQGYWGRDKTVRVLDRFARYNIPIHFTETTLVSGDLMPKEIEDLNDYKVTDWPTTAEGEQRQADELEDWYRTLASHPLVEAITYWGMGDRSMWLGAPGGLVRKDGSVKPGFTRLHDLIKGEWWLAPTIMRTNEAGEVEVSGWKGDYSITAPDGSVTNVTLA